MEREAQIKNERTNIIGGARVEPTAGVFVGGRLPKAATSDITLGADEALLIARRRWILGFRTLPFHFAREKSLSLSLYNFVLLLENSGVFCYG